MSSKPLSQAAPGRSSGYSLQAPAASAATPLRCPGQGDPLPRIDEHLVEPELSGLEVLRGQRIQVMGANAEHADPHCQLDHVLWPHVAPGYVASTDLQTRFTLGSDFASDTCIRRAGINPKTDSRYLEELAFEIVNEQHTGGLTGVSAKAVDMQSRGVRRIFGLFVKSGEVREWERGAWRPLALSASITDITLIRPLPVRALLDAAEADNAVAEALLAKDNPVLRKHVAASEAKGERLGLERGLLDLCEVLDISMTAERRAHLASLGRAELESLRTHIKAQRAWPQP